MQTIQLLWNHSVEINQESNESSDDMYQTLIIIGAGGHGSSIADIARQTNKWKNIIFLDDNFLNENTLSNSVVGSVSEASKYRKHADFIVGIGDNKVRKDILKLLISDGYSIATLIHPKTIISENVSIGRGTVIMPGVTINNATTIGTGCIINTNSSIDHDNRIDDFVHISPGVITGGSVNIEELCWLGLGSIVSNNIDIVAKSIVGAGAVVIKDIVSPGVYIGLPAKKVTH